jgi:hypothetical protein
MRAHAIMPRSGEERAAYIAGFTRAARLVLDAWTDGRSLADVRTLVDATLGLLDANRDEAAER